MQRAMAKILDNGDILIRPKTAVSLDHIETLYGSDELMWLDFELVDKRKARAQQRRLFFALLHDIEEHFIVPQDFFKADVLHAIQHLHCRQRNQPVRQHEIDCERCKCITRPSYRFHV